VEAPGGKSGNVQTRGKAMANYPYELSQDAAYQSHTGRLIGIWFLPKLAQGLNTNNNKFQIVYLFIYLRFFAETLRIF